MPIMRMGIYKKLASCMAILAVLFAFFAPTVSQAMSGDGHSNVIYQKVCTEHGTKVIPVELPAGNHHGVPSHSGHCSFCCTSAHSPIINSSTAVVSLDSNEFYFRLVPTYDSPVVQVLFQASHPPQAPPAV